MDSLTQIVLGASVGEVVLGKKVGNKAMLYGAIFTAFISLGRGQSFTMDWSFPYVASLLYLAIFGSVIAFWSYLTLLGRIGANKAGYATIAFPVMAILLSVLFEGLTVTVT